MISFTDPDGNDISLDYKGTICARQNGQVIASCQDSPCNWDDWEVTIEECSDGKALHLQYALANLWTANQLATRFLSRRLLF